MAGKKTNSGTQTGATREDRLKAALKANLARRKAQSRGRATKAAATSGSKAGAEQEKDK